MDKIIAPVGTKVYMYMFDFIDGSGVFQKHKTSLKKASNVILNNGSKIVLDDEGYTSISLVDSMGVMLEKPCLHIRVGDTLFGNTLNVLLYSTKELTSEDFVDIIESKFQTQSESFRLVCSIGIDEMLNSDEE